MEGSVVQDVYSVHNKRDEYFLRTSTSEENPWWSMGYKTIYIYGVSYNTRYVYKNKATRENIRQADDTGKLYPYSWFFRIRSVHFSRDFTATRNVVVIHRDPQCRVVHINISILE